MQDTIPNVCKIAIMTFISWQVYSYYENLFLSCYCFDPKITK
jgi:hypothetical protein